MPPLLKIKFSPCPSVSFIIPTASIMQTSKSNSWSSISCNYLTTQLSTTQNMVEHSKPDQISSTFGSSDHRPSANTTMFTTKTCPSSSMTDPTKFQIIGHNHSFFGATSPFANVEHSWEASMTSRTPSNSSRTVVPPCIYNELLQCGGTMMPSSSSALELLRL